MRRNLKTRFYALFIAIVMICATITWMAPKEAKAGETEEASTVTLEQIPGEATASAGGGISRWADESWGFSQAGDYVTFTFDISVSGKYQLLHQGSVSGTGKFQVTVDRVPYTTITLTGIDSNTTIETEAGSYYLEAGKHTVKFTYTDTTAPGYSTAFFKITLKQTENVPIVALQDDDKDAVTTTAPDGYSDYSADNEMGYIGFWNAQTVTFNDVNIPKSGIYSVYVDGASDSDGNRWEAVVNDVAVSGIVPNTGNIGIMSRQKLGSIEINEGTITLQINAQVASGAVSMIRVVFIWEGGYITQIPGEATASEGSGISRWADESWGFSQAGDYVTFTFDISVSGKYQLLHQGSVSGTGKFQVSVDRVPYTTITLTGTDSNTTIETDAGCYYLEAGKHTVKFTYTDTTAPGYSTAFFQVRLGRLEQVTVVALQDDDKDAVTTTAPDGYSDYSADNANGYIAFWNAQTVTFNDVNIPESGTYGVYVDGASDSDGNRWEAVINDVAVSEIVPNTGNIGTMVRQKLGSIGINQGTFTLQMNTKVVSGAVSMTRVVFIREGDLHVDTGSDIPVSGTYEKMTLRDYLLEEITVSNNEMIVKKHDNSSLDATSFGVTVTFSKETVGTAALYLGGSIWQGFRIEVTPDGNLGLSHLATDGTQTWIASVTPQSVGVESFLGKPFDLLLTFDIVEQDATYADCKIGLYINGKMYEGKHLLLRHAERETLKRALFIYNSGEGTFSVQSLYREVDFRIWGLKKENWKQVLGI